MRREQRMSRATRMWIMSRLVGPLCAAALALALTSPQQAWGQTHTTGVAVTKTCPVTANNGAVVTCTATIENLDPDHSLVNITVTNQAPFPGGPITTVTGCPSSLQPNDGSQGSGTDFGTCTFTETT